MHLTSYRSVVRTKDDHGIVVVSCVLQNAADATDLSVHQEHASVVLELLPGKRPRAATSLESAHIHACIIHT